MFCAGFVPIAAISSAGGINNVAMNLVNQDPSFFLCSVEAGFLANLALYGGLV